MKGGTVDFQYFQIKICHRYWFQGTKLFFEKNDTKIIEFSNG